LSLCKNIYILTEFLKKTTTLNNLKYFIENNH